MHSGQAVKPLKTASMTVGRSDKPSNACRSGLSYIQNEKYKSPPSIIEYAQP